MGKFLWVLFGIAVFGIAVNILPPVRRWADTVHDNSYKDDCTNENGEDLREHATKLDED